MLAQRIKLLDFVILALFIFLALPFCRFAVDLTGFFAPTIIRLFWQTAPLPASSVLVSSPTPTSTTFTLSLDAAGLSGDYQGLQSNDYISLFAIGASDDGNQKNVIIFSNLRVHRVLNEQGRLVQFNGGVPATIHLEIPPDRRDELLLLLEREPRMYIAVQPEGIIPTPIPEPTSTPYPTQAFQVGQVSLAVPVAVIASPRTGLTPGMRVEILVITNDAPADQRARFAARAFQASLLEALDANGAPTAPDASSAATLKLLTSPSQAIELAAALGSVDSVYVWAPAAPDPTPSPSP